MRRREKEAWMQEDVLLEEWKEVKLKENEAGSFYEIHISDTLVFVAKFNWLKRGRGFKSCLNSSMSGWRHETTKRSFGSFDTRNLPDSDCLSDLKRDCWWNDVVLIEFPHDLSLSKLGHGLRVASSVLSLSRCQPPHWTRLPLRWCFSSSSQPVSTSFSCCFIWGLIIVTSSHFLFDRIIWN